MANSDHPSVRRMPMFPLGSVLFPGFGLPLHVFEPRYRFMVEVLLAGPEADREFGVVLIERGSEVGGGDRRFNVGTVARIVAAEELPDGRWYVQSVGVGRIRVVEWLPDAPYPQAMVETLSDVQGTLREQELIDEIDRAVKVLRRTLALSSEAGLGTAPATIELDDEPSVRLWQACGLAPIGPLDDVALLSAETMTDRAVLLRRSLEDASILLSHRLSEG